MKKSKLLMIYDKRSTFVGRDVEILAQNYSVTEFHFNVHPKSRTPIAFIHQFFILLVRGWTLKKVVCQSAGYLSFLPALFSKVMPFKCYIIAIGTDASRLVEINYGHFTKPLLRWFTVQSYILCHKILPVHKSLHMSDYTYEKIQFPKQGFGNFIPRLRTPVTEVINGYKHELFIKSNSINGRPKEFLTVAVRLNKAAYFRKGLDLIFKVAQSFPKSTFTVVSEFTPLDEVPKNVNLIKTVQQAELVKIYNEHKYYLQLSMFEGFPNALCEAMLCGCVPIGSDVAAIPEIIDKTGFILKNKSITELKILLTEALNSDLDSLPDSRDRILENFPIERRSKELNQALSE